MALEQLSVDVVFNMHIDTRELGHKTKGSPLHFSQTHWTLICSWLFMTLSYLRSFFTCSPFNPIFLCIFTTQDPKRTSSRYLSVAIALMIKLYKAAKHWCLSWCRAPFWKVVCKNQHLFRGELWLCFLFQGKDLHHCWFTVTYLSFYRSERFWEYDHCPSYCNLEQPTWLNSTLR